MSNWTLLSTISAGIWPFGLVVAGVTLGGVATEQEVSMIREVTGIRSIRMLYVQLLYRCNFTCQHCFHGELLAARDHYTPAEVSAILRYFRHHYDLRAVTFLGGEPLLHPEVAEICRDAHGMGLPADICTNGHFGFRHRLEDVAPYLAKLRVSLEGLRNSNDRIRQAGSFDSAMETIALARRLGITVGVTMTVTALNVDEVVPLARLLEERGVRELKLHHMRPVGNATIHPELLVADQDAYGQMYEQVNAARLRLDIIYDAELSPTAQPAACQPHAGTSAYLDRLEVDPRGGLTMSCKAVGHHASAFRWDKAQASVVYTPHADDELTTHIPDVVYRTV